MKPCEVMGGLFEGLEVRLSFSKKAALVILSKKLGMSGSRSRSLGVTIDIKLSRAIPMIIDMTIQHGCDM